MELYTLQVAKIGPRHRAFREYWKWTRAPRAQRSCYRPLGRYGAGHVRHEHNEAATDPLAPGHGTTRGDFKCPALPLFPSEPRIPDPFQGFQGT